MAKPSEKWCKGGLMQVALDAYAQRQCKENGSYAAPCPHCGGLTGVTPVKDNHAKGILFRHYDLRN